MFAVELHAHSAASYDGRDSIEALLEQAQAVELDGLAVTDHDELAESLRAAELAADYGLLGIPGLEVTSEAGHVLALGVRELVPKGLSFDETIDRIHDQGAIAVVPHPFQPSRSGVAANVSSASLARADAIEIYNSRLLTGRGNRRAEKFATKHDLPTTAGSDAHIAGMVGRAITRIDAREPTVDAILDAIREGRTEIGGRRTPWRVSFLQAAGGAKRRVRARLRNLL